MSEWGPPIWNLFHTLAAKVHEENYQFIAPHLFGFVKRICSLLPCPECQDHAIKYLNSKKYDVTTKEKLIDYLFTFHNDVNKRKGKAEADISILETYKHGNLADVYNRFVIVFKARHSPKLLADTLHRSRLLSDFKQWLMNNAKYFY